MRLLKRSKKKVYYALYSGNTEIKVNGLYTGERTKLYEDVVGDMFGVSGVRTAYGYVPSVVTMQMQGLDKPYSMSMWTSDMTCPITEETIIWLGFGDIETYSTAESYAIGDVVIYDGVIYRCIVATTGAFDSDNWEKVIHNYIVTGVSKSLNYIAYALKEVDFS